MLSQAIPRATKNHKILKKKDLQIPEGRYGAQIDRFWREGGELKLCLNSSRSVLRSAPFLTRCEATALLKRNPKPSRSQILDAMNPHLCRCCGYRNILASVELAARASEASDA